MTLVNLRLLAGLSGGDNPTKTFYKFKFYRVFSISEYNLYKILIMYKQYKNLS